jgi:hypothetical protein
MNWQVTYRGSDGKHIVDEFEAESREALFAALKAKGVNAIKVAECKTGKRSRQGATLPQGAVARKPSRPVARAIVWAIVGVAVAIAAWFIATREEATQGSARDQVRQPTKLALPEPTLPGRPLAETAVPVDSPATNSSPWPERSPHPDGLWRHGEGPRSIAVTNGCLVTYPHCPDVQLVLPHPAFAAPFENISDNEIARIISAKPGDDFIDAPLPANFDEQFAKSILEPIVITDEDTPEKAELKKQVMEARKLLVAAVKRGESPREILTEEAKALRRLMQIRDNYQRLVNEQIDAGASDQDVSDLVRAANQLLENEGVDAKVMLPYKTKLRIEQGKSEGTVLD